MFTPLLLLIITRFKSSVSIKNMISIVFKKTGKPEDVLEIMDLPIPEPAENEIRVKVLASPVNPADILFIQGQYRIKPTLPQTAGLEGAGIIDKVGSNVSLPVNTLITFRHKNVWAEYAIIPLEKATVLPPGFPLEKACQFSLNPITAHALLEESTAQADDWLLLTAGNSAIAKIIIQLAKARRIKTIVVVRNMHDRQELEALGATIIVADNAGTLQSDIKAITHTTGVKCILDAVGGQLITELIPTISAGGQLLSYGLMSKDNVSYHNAGIIFKNITIKGFGIDHWLNSMDADEQQLTYQSLIKTLTDPAFKLPVAARLPFKDFKKAFTLNALSKKSGKIIFEGIKGET